jgi:release factor glutamine methyltransferase
LALPDGVVPDGGFDVLMSNPPYVTSDAFGRLASTVRDFEPRRAVTDGGDGLSFYRSIAADAPSILAARGVVFVEVDDGAAQRVVGIVESTGGLTHERTWKDSVAGRERVLMFSRR